MKNKLKYILLVVGVAVVIFGALIPTIFKRGSVDKFTYDRDGHASEYSITINVVSKKEYEIESATIILEDAFDEYNTKEKTINSPVVTKKKVDGEFVYTFVVDITQDEFFDYSKVSEVVIETNIGERVAEEKSLTGINWRTPVMIVVIFLGVGLTIAGVSMIASAKAYKNYAEQTRKELARTNPEINTSDMTDEEVIAKKREINQNKNSEKGGILSSLFGIEEKPKEKVCSYCGAVNGAESTKCSSCGASLKAKK